MKRGRNVDGMDYYVLTTLDGDLSDGCRVISNCWCKVRYRPSKLLLTTATYKSEQQRESAVRAEVLDVGGGYRTARDHSESDRTQSLHRGGPKRSDSEDRSKTGR